MPGKDYSLNWSLTNEWFTVWGNAYRNPCPVMLSKSANGSLDSNKNVTCTRKYLASSEVQTKKGDFEEISDSVNHLFSHLMHRLRNSFLKFLIFTLRMLPFVLDVVPRCAFVLSLTIPLLLLP
jgi:hypothetical protein